MLLLYEKNNKEQQIEKKKSQEISNTRSIFIGKKHLQFFQMYYFLMLSHISINYMLTQITWLSNNFQRPGRRKNKSTASKKKCEHKFDTKSSKNHKHSCFKTAKHFFRRQGIHATAKLLTQVKQYFQKLDHRKFGWLSHLQQ